MREIKETASGQSLPSYLHSRSTWSRRISAAKPSQQHVRRKDLHTSGALQCSTFLGRREGEPRRFDRARSLPPKTQTLASSTATTNVYEKGTVSYLQFFPMGGRDSRQGLKGLPCSISSELTRGAWALEFLQFDDFVNTHLPKLIYPRWRDGANWQYAAGERQLGST
jgi:hypothetical protein